MLTTSGKIVGVTGAALLALGIVLGYLAPVLFGSMLLAALGVAALWMATRPRIEAVRSVNPSRVQEGEGARGVLTVTNKGRRRSPPFVAVEWFNGESFAIALPSLQRQSNHEASYVLATERRGRYPVGPLTIGHADPLRLMSSGQASGVAVPLVVHPRLHDVAPIPTGHSREIDGPALQTAPRGGIAFHSLREYVPGDDLRLIHWRSFARTGELMVRHNVVTIDPRLMVVLDTRATSYDADYFDHAVRVAASLLVSGVRHHYPVELRTTGGLGSSVDAHGFGLLAALDLLAEVEAAPDDPGLAALVRMIMAQKGVSLGVVTGHPPPEELAAVSLVRSRFEMVSVVEIGETWNRPPPSVRGAFAVQAESSDEFEDLWNRRVPR